MEARLTEREEALTLQAPPALDLALGPAAGAPAVAEPLPPMPPPDGQQQQLDVEPAAGNGVRRAAEAAGGLVDGGLVADLGATRHADAATGDAAAPMARVGVAGGDEAAAGSAVGDRAAERDPKAPRDRNGYFVFRFPGGRS